MFKFRSYFHIAVIVAGLCMQQCGGEICDALLKVTESFQSNNRCRQWKLPTPPKNQAILVKLNTINPKISATLSDVGTIHPKLISCVIYRSKRCAVAPTFCESGSMHVLTSGRNSFDISVANPGDIEVSYKLLPCSDNLKVMQQSPTDIVIWIAVAMATAACLIAIYQLVTRRSKDSSTSSKSRHVEERAARRGDLEMAEVERERNQSTFSVHSRRASHNEPSQEVTVFDGREPPRGGDGSDEDSSDEERAADRPYESIANVTNRIVKQGAEKQIYVEIDEIRKKKQQLGGKDSDEVEGGESSSEESENERDTSEKKDDDVESSSSSDGEDDDGEDKRTLPLRIEPTRRSETIRRTAVNFTSRSNSTSDSEKNPNSISKDEASDEEWDKRENKEGDSEEQEEESDEQEDADSD